MSENVNKKNTKPILKCKYPLSVGSLTFNVAPVEAAEEDGILLKVLVEEEENGERGCGTKEVEYLNKKLKWNEEAFVDTTSHKVSHYTDLKARIKLDEDKKALIIDGVISEKSDNPDEPNSYNIYLQIS